MSSDPSVDLEKGTTGLKEEEKGITELKEEEEKAAHQLKVTCVTRLLGMIPVVFLAGAIVAVVVVLRTENSWFSWLVSLILALGAIFLFWKFRKLNETNVERMLGNAHSDLSTTLLASTPKRSGVDWD